MGNARRSEQQGKLRFRKPFVPRLEHQIALELVKLRIKMNLTQADMAKKIGTTQSAVSRAESGRRMPSLRFLDKIAQAFDTRVVVRLEPAAAGQEQEGWLEPYPNVIYLSEYLACHAPHEKVSTWEQPKIVTGIQGIPDEASIA